MAENRDSNPTRAGLAERVKSFLRPLIPLRYRPQAFFDRWLERTTGNVVRGGPFQGMQYIDEARQEIRLLPRLLGTYEIELREPLERAIARGYPRVVNIGGGEGYYVVGLARALPGAHVVAYEANEQRQDLIRLMAARNDVGDRVEVHGRCEPADLSAAVGGARDCLLVMDVEGAELALLDPAIAPGLAGCAILVEVHDFVDERLSVIIRERFAATHEIEEIEQRARTLADFPMRRHLGTTRLLRKRYVKSMDEGRPDRMSWLSMIPRQGPGPHSGSS